MNDRIKNAFADVHAEESLKRGTKTMLQERMTARRAPFAARRLALTLSCFVLLFLGLGCGAYLKPVSAISIDVNPSIELGVNRFDRIVSIKGYNADGDALASAVPLRFMKYTDALTALMDSAPMRPYLENDAVVSISVLGNTEEKSGEMLSRITACHYAATPNVECHCTGREEAEEAHEAGLSFGKYRAFLELQALDPTVMPEDVQGLSMHEIRERIAELSGAPYDGCENAGGKAHGGGHGHGG